MAAALSTKFGNNVLDATKAFSLKLTTPEQVAGLPPSALAMMAASARAKGDEGATAEAGPWVATLDGPCLLAVLQRADDAALREQARPHYHTLLLLPLLLLVVVTPYSSLLLLTPLWSALLGLIAPPY